jgi:hypothetical protein
LCNADIGKAEKQQQGDGLVDYKALTIKSCEVASIQDEFN